MKLCKDCCHFGSSTGIIKDVLEEKYYGICFSPHNITIDLVTGKQKHKDLLFKYCHDQRTSNILARMFNNICGPNAKYFKSNP